MPIYVYKCNKCGAVEEDLYKNFESSPDAYGCHSCAEGDMERQVTASKPVFVGEGWTTPSSNTMEGAFKMNQQLKKKSSRG